MSKKVAFLVDMAMMTRVVVEVPDEFNEMEDSAFEPLVFNEIVKKATANYIERINNNEVGENITEVVTDDECPYGTFPTD